MKNRVDKKLLAGTKIASIHKRALQEGEKDTLLLIGHIYALEEKLDSMSFDYREMWDDEGA